MTFKELNITEPILKAIGEKGYTVPTPIQEKAIPPALAKRDILGCAQTGTGKTASFAIPIIQHLQLDKEAARRQGIKALILTPTRELALQISECIDDYSKHTASFAGREAALPMNTTGWTVSALKKTAPKW